jgi:hypothetical protein
MAEAISQFFPGAVELHNYPAANSYHSKLDNWKTLNNKTLVKLGIKLKGEQCEKLAAAAPGHIELLLKEFKRICEECQMARGDNNEPTLTEQELQQCLSAEKKQRREAKNLKGAKVEELREILKFLKDKIAFV